MTELRIAGHVFAADRTADTCSVERNGEVCGRRLADISNTTEEDIGRPDIACYGLLNWIEYQTIVDYREHVWKSLYGAHAE